MTNVIRGQQATLQTMFMVDEQPMIFKDAPSWKILDFNNNVILDGYGIQNTLHPQEWFAVFTLPTDAPIDIDLNYSIQWKADIEGNIYRNSESFTVLEEGEPFALDGSNIMLVNSNLHLTAMFSSPPINPKVEIFKVDGGNPIYESSEPAYFTTRKFNNFYALDFNPQTKIPGINDNYQGAYPFMINWNYESDTRPNNTEIQTLYVITPKVAYYIDALRRYMDKARNYDINPNLRWTEAELTHFLLIGLSRINAAPPSMTEWTIPSLPKSLEYFLLKCAEVEALNALYLAEGFSAFDFQGASTQLNVDRTQYIQYKIDEINSWLDGSTGLKAAKDTTIRNSNSGGALSLSLTPSTNLQVRLNTNFILSRFFRYSNMT